MFGCVGYNAFMFSYFLCVFFLLLLTIYLRFLSKILYKYGYAWQREEFFERKIPLLHFHGRNFYFSSPSISEKICCKRISIFPSFKGFFDSKRVVRAPVFISRRKFMNFLALFQLLSNMDVEKSSTFPLLSNRIHCINKSVSMESPTYYFTVF